jgi:hypothetical protein
MSTHVQRRRQLDLLHTLTVSRSGLVRIGCNSLVGIVGSSHQGDAGRVIRVDKEGAAGGRTRADHWRNHVSLIQATDRSPYVREFGDNVASGSIVALRLVGSPGVDAVGESTR